VSGAPEREPQKESPDQLRFGFLRHAFGGVGFDLRHSIRALLVTPLTTIVVVVTLAVSIGITALAVSTAHTIGFGTVLPYEDADRLVEVVAVTIEGGYATREIDYRTSLFEVVRDESDAFEGTAAFVERSFTLSNGDLAVSVRGARVTPDLFRVLRVQPARGRTFNADEPEATADEEVVISHRLWVQRFGSDPEILGQTLLVDAVPRVIIGVMPEGFAFFLGSLLWAPLTGAELQAARVIGRLADGVSQEAANVDVYRLSDVLVQRPGSRPSHLGTRPLGSEFKFLRWTAFAAVLPVGFILLIACANVAGLLLAGGVRRRGEMAMRAVLGGGRGRLVCELLAESLLLASAGAVVGLWVARFAAGALTRFADGLYRDSIVAFYEGAYASPAANALHFDLDPAVVTFTVGCTAFVMMAIGLAPALELSRADLSQAVRGGGFGATASRRVRRWQRMLTVSQVALSAVFLVGTALTLRSLVELRHFDPGFDVDRVVQLELRFPLVGYPETRRARLIEAAIDRFHEVPGVEAVAAVWNRDREEVLNVDKPVDLRWRGTSGNVVGPEYFSTLGIPVLRGREFTQNDDRSAPRVAVVNERAARGWPGGSAIGRTIDMRKLDGASEPYVIVGVVADVVDRLAAIPLSGLRPQARPEVYLTGLQAGAEVRRIYVRTSVPPDRMAETLRRAIWSIDPNLPVAVSRWTGEGNTALALLVVRWIGTLAAILAVLALIVATGGIYTVVAYQASQREREMGIRMALGARTADIRKVVLGDGIVLACSGIVLGLLGSLLVAVLLGHYIFGVAAFNPLVYAGVALVLAAATLLASWLPARRAARVHPAIMLRQD
jgi:predicted permease